MGVQQVADIIQIRRDTAANWTSADPTLAQGEMGYETDTGKLKFGDGSTAWSSLSYYYAGSAFLSDTNPVISAGTLTEDVFTITGGDPSISPNNGSVQLWALTGNDQPEEGTWGAGQAITLMVDDGTAYTIDWSQMSVTWVNNGGAAPTLATSGYTVIALWKVGSTLYGALVGDGT
jgi:hypothetical protein